ncbi:hypothetical protein IAI18_05270 [Acetobacteraceae bacterium H6797]|nr:hypothetical protein [Acetobacteraceae bacterium H6797]
MSGTFNPDAHSVGGGEQRADGRGHLPGLQPSGSASSQHVGLDGYRAPTPVQNLDAAQSKAELDWLMRPGSSYWSGDQAAVERALQLRQAQLGHAETARQAEERAPLDAASLGMAVSRMELPANFADGATLMHETQQALASLGADAEETRLAVQALGAVASGRVLTQAQGAEELHRRLGYEAAERTIADAQRAFRAVQQRSPSAAEAIVASGAANDPAMVMALARAAPRLATR